LQSERSFLPIYIFFYVYNRGSELQISLSCTYVYTITLMFYSTCICEACQWSGI